MMIVVALALFDSDGRVLMQRRPEGKHHGGLWEYPGGKVEAGETPTAALVREIDEELAITVREDDMTTLSFAVSDDPARPLILLLYACHAWSGTPVCEPGAALQWAARAELGGLAMPPLDIVLSRTVINLTK